MKDENDKAITGELPEDPEEGTRVVDDGPRLVTVKELLGSSLKRAIKPRSQRTGTTGNQRLDQITGGFRSGFTWVMGAETNWGKSSWIISVADENLRRGVKVLIVSTEDAPSVYGDRLLARRSRVNAKRMRDGQLEPDEVTAITNAVQKAEPIPVYLDAIGKSVEWVVRILPTVIHEYDINIVCVDYLQEMYSEKRHQDRRIELASIARALRAEIKRAGCCGIIASQLTISKDKKRPDKYSIRDSQDVSNGAEVVVLGYTPDKDIDSPSAGRIEAGTRVLLVDKNKDGPKGTVALEWDADSACFGKRDGFEDFDAVVFGDDFGDDFDE